MKLLKTIDSVFQGPTMQKILAKLSNKAFVAPVVYSMIFMAIFAIIYALIGFKNHFQTTDQNKDKNIENSINASIFLQTNAMGSVTPTTSLGTWLMTTQVFVGWLWFMVIVGLVT